MRRLIAPGALAGALVVNYLGYRTRLWPTLCGTTRTYVRPGAFDAALIAGVLLLRRHWRAGLPQVSR